MARQTTAAGKRSGLAEPAILNPEPKQIEVLAYQLWLERGCPVGDDQRDWFQAEEQLRQTELAAA